jgi:hypothetical protein
VSWKNRPPKSRQHRHTLGNRNETGLRQAGLNGRLVEDHLKRLGARVFSVTLEHTTCFIPCLNTTTIRFNHVIMALVLVEKCPVVSSDQRFPLYARAGLKVFWDD